MRVPARILIADDHPIFRAGLAMSLKENADFSLCGEAASADESVQLASSTRPDLVLLDLSMPGGGQSALVRILANDPSIKVVVLTASEDDDDVLAALRAGAAGYIVKGIGSAELCQIVAKVLDGESYVSPWLAARILSELGDGRPVPATPAADAGPLQRLTTREDAVLRLVARGLGNKQIARQLDLQEKTIKNHMTRILAKLQARSRLEAALMLREAESAAARD